MRAHSIHRVPFTVNNTDAQVTVVGPAGIGDVVGVVVWLTNITTLDTSTNGYSIATGYCDGSNTHSVCSWNQNNVTVVNNGQVYSSTYLSDLVNPAGGTLCRLSFDSFTTDGAVLNVDTNPASTIHGMAIIIAGDGVEATAFQANSPVTDQTVSTGHPVDYILCSGTETLTSTTGVTMCHGFATQSGVASVALASKVTTIPSNTGRAHFTDRLSASFNFTADPPTITGGNTVANFTSTGFDVVKVATQSQNLIGIAVNMNGGSAFIESGTTPTSTGVVTETSPGDRPCAVLVIGTANTTNNACVGGGSLSIGMFDYRSVQWSLAVADSDGVSPRSAQRCKMSVSNIQEIITMAGTASTTQYVSALDELLSNGFEFDATTVSASARTYSYLAIEEQPITATGAANLPDDAASGTLGLSLALSGTANLPDDSGSGTLALSLAASGAGTLPDDAAAGALALSLAASGAANVPLTSAQGSLLLSLAASGVAVVPGITATGQLGLAFVATGAGILPLRQAAGSITQTLTAQGGGTLPVSAASGHAALTLFLSGSANLPGWVAASSTLQPAESFKFLLSSYKAQTELSAGFLSTEDLTASL